MWNLNIIGLIVLCAVGSLAFESFDSTNRIVNGTQAHERRFTYHVQLVRMVAGRLQFFCSGAPVADRFVITVARCVNQFTVPQELVIRSGPSSTHGTNHLVQRIYIHPRFNPRTVENDIALVRSLRPLEFGRWMTQIRLPTVGTAEGTTIIAVGWGSTTANLTPSGQPPPPSRFRHFSEGRIIPRQECIRQIGQSGRVHTNTFCTTVQSCFWDRGNPIVDRNGLLVGLSSVNAELNRRCAAPDVNVAIFAHLRWIDSVLFVNPPESE